MYLKCTAVDVHEEFTSRALRAVISGSNLTYAAWSHACEAMHAANTVIEFALINWLLDGGFGDVRAGRKNCWGKLGKTVGSA